MSTNKLEVNPTDLIQFPVNYLTVQAAFIGLIYSSNLIMTAIRERMRNKDPAAREIPDHGLSKYLLLNVALQKFQRSQ